MMQKRKHKRNQHMIEKTIEAMTDITRETLKVLTPNVQPEQRIENMIRFNVNEADLTKWRNEGWIVQHYDFLGKELAVVMERTVEVLPEPIVEVVETEEPPAVDIPVIEEKVAPFTIEIVADNAIVVDVPAPTLSFEAALRNPDMSFADVIEVGNVQILNAARDAYNALQPTIEKYCEPIEVSHG